MATECMCKWSVVDEFREGSLYIENDHLYGMIKKVLVRDVTSIICSFPGHALSTA